MRLILCILGAIACLGEVRASSTVLILNSTNIHNSGIIVKTHPIENGLTEFKVIVTPQAGPKPADWEGALRIKRDHKMVASCKVAAQKPSGTFWRSPSSR